MLVTIRHGVVCVRFRSRTVIGHALHSSCPSLLLLPFWFSAQFYFVPPFPSLLCLGWITTDHPRSWVISVFGLSVGCCFSYSWYRLAIASSTRWPWWYWWPVPRWWGGPPDGHLPVSGGRLFMVGCGRFTSEPGVLPNVAPRLPLVRVVTPYCLCERS